MSAVTHACGEDGRFATMCRRDVGPGDRLSCYADQWDCPRCLRLLRLLGRVQAAADALRRRDDADAVLAAVAPGRTVDLLDEGEARRVLAVLGLLVAAEAGR